MERRNLFVKINTHLIVNNEVEAYIFLIRKNFKWLLLIGTIIMLGYFAFQYSNYHYYKSECTIIVNQDVINFGATNYSVMTDNQMPASSSDNRLMYIFNSNAIHDSLLYRMDLINHYNIRKTSAFRYEKVLRKMANLISLTKVDNNIYKIYVRDKERTMAADIANQIPQFINVVARDLMLKNLKTKVLKYQTLIDTLSKQNSSIQKLEFELVQKVSPSDMRLVDIQKFVTNTLSTLKGINEGNIHQIEAYKFILANEKEMDLNAVTVLTKAIPDVNLGYDFLGFAVICLYVYLGVFAAFLFGVVFYKTNKDYIQLLLFGKIKS